MSDYSMKELFEWNDKIEAIVKDIGLLCYEQEFEICSFEDMIGYETYIGMPSHYPHWSYGKSYEKTKTLHKYNLTGLPYEMVINSNPCLAYLMKDNTLLLQILTIAHVYGHNDFFKNNRLFKIGTRANYTIEMFKNHATRIREYISDPTIGYKRVEKILDAAHSIKHNTKRVPGEKNINEKEKLKELLKKNEPKEREYPLIFPKVAEDISEVELRKVPFEPEDDILLFLTKYSKLSEWEKDILSIVREEGLYFIPQIETKIMNEGWASYWHYNILNKLNLPQGMQIEFLKRHNAVIRPHVGSINPYYVGFKIFEDLMKKNNGDHKKIFEVREIERDQSFIRKYLTAELCEELNLFAYAKKGTDYIVTEVADDDGWKKIRNSLANSVGMGSIPSIRVTELVQKDNTLILEHQFEGKELELNYAYETMKQISNIWDGKVVLSTLLDNKRKVITCDEQKKITLTTL